MTLNADKGVNPGLVSRAFKRADVALAIEFEARPWEVKVAYLQRLRLERRLLEDEAARALATMPKPLRPPGR